VDLSGRVALVTGGGRGIGPALCRALGENGAKVAVNYRSSEAGAQSTIDAIRAAGGEARAFRADVSDPAEVAAMFVDIRTAFGPVDILVNNAAIYPRTTWESISPAEWDQVFAINVRGSFLCAKEAAQDMVRRSWGRIVNFGSVAYPLGLEGYVHYVSSKGAIVGLTRGFASELGPHHITVNTISPGGILTETELEDYPDQEARTAFFAARQALPGRLESDDLAGALLFLVSDGAAYVTGQTLLVDGGWIKH
jgi:3-oxoacyl-[acyl-carrier protein] reductase